MDRDRIVKEWEKYKIIMDGDYRFLMYDTLNRIANALEKIAEENKSWQKIDTENGE